jgi:retron-type reverse transcriptase
MKETNFLCYSTFKNTSDLNKVVFKISKEKKITDILARVGSPKNLMEAHKVIKSNPDNISLELGPETLDTLSSNIIRGRFKFYPPQHVIAPQKSREKRPFSIISSTDKIVYQAIKQQLHLLFGGPLLGYSHRFRPSRSCHSAFNQIKIQFGRLNWAVKGDINNCLENIKFSTFYPLIRLHVTDKGFEALIRKFFKAGYTINELQEVSGNITHNRSIKPILINIIFHELDKFIVKEENKVKARYKQTFRRNSKRDPTTPIKNRIPNYTYSLNNTSIKYIRYENDFIVGVGGGKKFCKSIKNKITEFLYEKLGLTLSTNKTKITNLISDRVIFLGA